MDIFFTASQQSVARIRSVVSFSPLLVFSFFNFLTIANAAKYLIYVSLWSGSSTVVKPSIGDAIFIIYMPCRVDGDWLIAFAIRRLISGDRFYDKSKFELTRVGLLVKLANHYATRGALKYILVIEFIILMLLNRKIWVCTYNIKNSCLNCCVMTMIFTFVFFCIFYATLA